MPAFVEVLTFRLRYGASGEFNYLIKKINEAINKSDWPVHYAWLTTVSGGKLGTYTLVFPRKNWADFKEPEKPFPAMLEGVYGRGELPQKQLRGNPSSGFPAVSADNQERFATFPLPTSTGLGCSSGRAETSQSGCSRTERSC